MTLSFPENIVAAIDASCSAIASIDAVFHRPLHVTDPHGSLGIFVPDWEPLEWEIGLGETPARQKYGVMIQILQKFANEEEGRIAHSQLTKSLRTMLYQDPDLQIALLACNETVMGRTERVTRNWKVTRQRFHSDALKGSFVFISATEMRVETATT